MIFQNIAERLHNITSIPKKVTISKTDVFFIAMIQQNIIIPTEKNWWETKSMHLI